MSNKGTSLIKSDEAAKNLADIQEPKNYVPSLKITYQTSEHFGEGKANLGDFFLSDQSLGGTIQVTAISYRYQAIALEQESKSFLESLVMGEGDVPFRETKEFKAFCTKHKDDTVDYGIDILLYLPEHNLFGVLFAKKKLLKGGLLILEKGGNGNLLSIKTIPKAWEKRKWYELEVTPMGKKINLPDETDDKVEIYENQIISSISENDNNKQSNNKSGRKR